MELVYLWVEKYKNIEKQGFNFSPKFRCEYNPETNELKIEENSNYGSIFLENINITAIVGKNGSGKTSILKILKYFTCNDCFVLIYNKKEGGFYVLGDFKSLDKFKIIKDIKKQGYKVLNDFRYKKYKIHNIFFSKTLEFYPDFNHDKQFSEHLSNISDEYLYEKFAEDIQNQYKHILKSFIQIKEIYKNEILQYGLRAFYESKVKFPKDWVSPINIEINFEYFYVFSSFDYIIRNLKEEKKTLTKKLSELSFYMENNDKVLEIKEQEANLSEKIENLLYVKSLFKINGEINWKYFVKYLSILNFIIQANQGIGSIINDEFIFEAIKSIKNIENKYKAIDLFMDFFNKDFEIDGAIYSIPKEYFNDIKKLINYLENFEKYYKKNYFLIPIDNSLEAILKIIKLHQKITVTIAKFLKFNLYPWMSDGHQEFFYIFAKIYMSLETPFTNKQPKKNDTIMMLLDEVENFFHPNWQKEFMSILIDFLNLNYKQYNFHIIITTHSPFIISDLPKENIIFLDKDENGKCKVVDGLNEKKETFGANIHTLLSDSFFMEDGLMGEFAKSKINEIIDFHNKIKENIENESLENEIKFYEENKDKFWNIQRITGEEYLKQIIKNHLIEIEKLLFGKDKAKEEEIKRLQKEIERLKSND